MYPNSVTDLLTGIGLLHRKMSAGIGVLVAKPPRTVRECKQMMTFSFAQGVVDLARAKVVYHDGQRCALSQCEVSILAYLARKQGVPVSRDELLAEVWKINPTNVLTRTIDMHMSNLRRKLRDNARKPVVLKTVNRRGYMLT